MENNITQTPSWLLIRASIPAKLAFAKTAEQFDLTFMQLLTLCLVESCQAESTGKKPAMHTITTVLGCDASNVTGLVDKLVSLGFLERRESPYDRRAKIIKLTDKGERVRSSALRIFDEGSFFNNLSPHEIDTLSRLLDKMLQAEHVNS